MHTRLQGGSSLVPRPVFSQLRVYYITAIFGYQQHDVTYMNGLMVYVRMYVYNTIDRIEYMTLPDLLFHVVKVSHKGITDLVPKWYI